MKKDIVDKLIFDLVEEYSYDAGVPEEMILLELMIEDESLMPNCLELFVRDDGFNYYSFESVALALIEIHGDRLNVG